MEKITKPFVKVTFEEIERAELFFENDKLLAEFILAVTFAYREIDYRIKNKTVEKYFANFSKIIQNKKKSTPKKILLPKKTFLQSFFFSFKNHPPDRLLF